MTNKEFEIKYNIYSKMLYRIIFGFTKNSLLADDILQDLFIKYINLNKIFKSKLGISKVFEPGMHFSKIADDFTFESELYHDSKLTVTNKGIEGAAVTTNFYYGSGEGIIYDNFVVDRDFAFVISNNDDEILFSGIIDRL